jgi:hypothetical protein
VVQERGFPLTSAAECAAALLGETLSLEGGPIFAVVQLVATFVELLWGQDLALQASCSGVGDGQKVVWCSVRS